ncbi:MAG: sigma-54-dependent Fis family transcriptional regulator [Planctomycetes bacterium]|nr:sigma-54-dependent Fis family transcriptional regulator [Planctomycetota bacterium]
MQTPAAILVIDDDSLILQCCKDVLGGERYRTVLATCGEEGIEYISRGTFDLIVTDLKMRAKDGLEVLRFAKENEPDVPVIILTGYPTLTSAIESVRLGAFDYLCKPVSPDELLLVVNRALQNRRLVLENKYLRQQTESRGFFREIIAHSSPMQEVLRQVELVASTESTVLLIGETGVGKELIARAIHRESPRKDRQFVVADCATLAPALLESELFGHVKGAFTGATARKAGLFEIAHGSTLFLDEVANVSMGTQSKLLRVLESHEYKPVGGETGKRADVRLIAATNADLQENIKAKTFREDLFYRLNVFPLRIPPLRERKEDIVFLAQHFLKHFADRLKKPLPSFTDEALEALKRHPWPGNVRELKNVLERVVIMTSESLIKEADISQQPIPEVALEGQAVPQNAQELKEAKKLAKKEAADEFERAFVIDALKKSAGNVSQAAREVGMQRTYFQALMKRHGISREENQTS